MEENTIRLGDVLPAVAAAAAKQLEGYRPQQIQNELLRELAFYRDCSAVPPGLFRPGPGVYEKSERISAVDKNTKVPSSLATFQYCEHDGRWELAVHQSQAALEQRVAQLYVNPFNSVIVVLHAGSVRPFQITYRTADGTRRVVTKADVYKPPDPFSREYPDARVEWTASEPAGPAKR